MRTFAIALITLLTGCAATYKPPESIQKNVQRDFPNVKKSDLMIAVKQVLVTEGFQITISDELSGVISTALRSYKLDPQHADCGTTMGLDYLKDNRTAGKLGWGLVITEGKVSVTPHMEASYLPGNTYQSINMVCASRGVLEHNLLDHISEAAR